MGPRRRGDDREDLGGFPGPGGRMGAQEQEQKRGCPPSCREYLGKRLWGSKGQSHHCSLAGVGRRGRMTSWPAQVSRRFILENNWDALWVSGVPESPARAWGLCRSLGWGPATPSLPWFFSRLRAVHTPLLPLSSRQSVPVTFSSEKLPTVGTSPETNRPEGAVPQKNKEKEDSEIRWGSGG